MVVRLRLARFGRKVRNSLDHISAHLALFAEKYAIYRRAGWLQNLPFYRIFVADSRCPRDGRHLEQVGHYDPIPGKDGNKHLGLNMERIRYWLSVGAQPSATVARLLGQAGVIPRPPPGLHRGTAKNPEKFAKK